MMSNRRGTLPTGIPPASSIPTYLTQSQQQKSSANESNTSVESFMSQVPQPFHLAGAEDSDYPPANTYRVDRTKSASPALQSTTFGGHNRSASATKMLNPNVRSYVPGNSPLMADAPIFEPRPARLAQDVGSRFEHGPELNSRANPLQHGSGYGFDNPVSSPQGQYAAINKPSYQSGTTHAVQYGGRRVNPPGPYDHFGIAGGMNSHNDPSRMQASSVNQVGYGGYAANYISGSPSSPGGYGVATQSQSSFQSMAYSNSGSGGYGIASSGYAGGQGYGQGYHNDPYVPAQQPTYSKNERYQPKEVAQNYNSGLNVAERSRGDYGTGTANGNGHGGQGTGYAGKQISFAEQKSELDQHSSQYGSSIPHTGKMNPASRPQSRPESGAGGDIQLSRNENRGILSQYLSPVGVSEKVDNVNTVVPTAGSRNQTTELGFSVEGQTKTPQLRSRRGQTIAPNESARKEPQLATCAESEAVTNTGGLRDINNLARSPPKPLGFALMSVPGVDPFTTPRKFNNPFTTSITPLTSLQPSEMNRFPDQPPSVQLRRLTNGGTRMPSVEEALDFANLPFAEYCRAESTGPDNFGVIKIKNIPYSVNRQEIMAFMGRNARLVNEFEHEPVHIVMERVTSKTLDCYVEFVNLNEAINAVNRFETNKNGGRGGRLGQRHVEIELSSQEQLMKDLFPKAKNVKWTNGAANIIPTDPQDMFNSGFQGFVSKEELVMLVKHVEAPQRSPFSKDCPQRPFECLISTLLKYPWYMVDYITIEDRNLLHDATKSLLSMLKHYVSQNREDTRLTGALLKRAWRSVLACPGFTPTMKDDIMVICDVGTGYAMEFGLAPQAADWRYLWAIGPKKGVPIDVLMFYIDLIRNITIQQRPRLTLAEQAAQGGSVCTNEYKLFGDLDTLIKYPPQLAYCTLANVAAAEWVAIETALRRALTPALE